MSNEAVNKIKSNITKSILGVSIAGVMITGAATEAKAEVVENPTAIVQEVKEEERARYKEDLAAIVEGILSKGEETASSASKDRSRTSTGEENVADNQIQTLSAKREEVSGDQELSAQRQENSAVFSSDENTASISSVERLSASEETDAQAQASKANAIEEPVEALSADQGQGAQADAQADVTAKKDAREENVGEVASTKEEVSSQEEPKTEETTEENNSSSLDALKNTDALGSIFDTEKIKEDAEKNLGSEDKIEVKEETTPEAQGAGETAKEEDKNLQKETDPNYAKDEKNIKDYNGDERYKETDLQPGDTNQTLDKDDEKVEKDGFKFDIKNPAETSPSKTEYGYEITIDKKTGQRTYTKVTVTDSGLIPVNPEDKPMMDEGDKLTAESPGVTYKPTENTELTAGGRQRNLNYEASEETLKHINNKDNDTTSFGFKDNYTQDNPGKKFFEGNFGITYKVNPWPNENDKLQLIKLNTEKYDSTKKYFVKSKEDIDIGIKVDNIDDSARERLVGQVYNPNTGKIVPGARAYIGSDDKIYIRMPEGAINEDGTINENSIFAKDPDYKGIQSLDVKFFARPRTADEFKAIAQAAEDEWDKGTYVETGAGTATINHKGQDVVIDRQGIDRYDHYNLIGDFKLNLDDTKFYEQKFNDENGKPTKDNVFSEVEPGKEFNINMKSDYGDNKEEIDKTPEDMKEAQKRREATAKANLQFFIENNKDKDGNLKDEEDRWKLSIGGKEIDLSKGDKELGVDDLSNIKVTAPSSAKAGEFVAIPVEYTYTNGSKDIHWFHFVVRESDNNIPTYESDAGTAETELTQTPKISDTEKDKKKNQPKSYKLAKTEYKDNKGNVWNVSIDETTGEVKATVPENAYIPAGGAKLKVDVEVTYEEEVEINGQKETRTYKEKTQAEFYSIPETRQEVSKKFESELPYKTTFEYDNTIPAGKVVEKGGEVGKQNLVFSQVVVGNKKGIVDENGKFVEGREALTTEVIKPAVDKVIKIGTKPAETKVEIPYDTEYELDYTKKKGEEPTEVRLGAKGEVTVKTTMDPETGEIKITQEESKSPTKRKLSIPAGTEGTHDYKEQLPFGYTVIEVDTLKKGEYEIVKQGKVGNKTTTWKIENSKIVGEPTVTTEEAEDAIINIGKGTVNGTHTIEEKVEVPFETIVEFDDSLKPGEQKVEVEGEAGEKTRTNTLTIEDGKVTKTEEGEYSQTKAPVNRVIKVGRNTEGTHSYEEKIPFKYNISYDDELNSGEYVIDIAGTDGTKKTTWTIKNSKVVGEAKVETTKPVDAKIRVGKKDFTGEITHEVKEEIPFKVKIIEDETLEVGKSEIVTQGQAGEKTTKFTQAIKNGQADGELKSEENTTKQPVEHVIRVGKKPATNHVEENSDVPVDIVYKYDPNMDVTMARKGDFTPGSVKTVVTNKYNPETGEIESVKQTVITNAKQEIVVGTKKYTGEFKNIIEEEIAFETEVIFDENIESGTIKVEQAGKVGNVKKEFIQHFDNGEQKSTEEKVIERTEPEKRIVRVGSKTEGEHQHKEKIPFKYTVKYDPDLEAGTYVEETQGRDGERVTIWKIKNSKIDGDPKTVETKPVDAVIKVGSKDFTGTFETKKSKAIEFETEYIVDNNMEPGTTEVIQKGELGLEETTVTHTIINGEVTRSEDGQALITKSPSKRIVKVGPGKTDGSHEYTNKIPFDVEVRVNHNLKKGEYKVVQKGEEGEEKYTLTIENSKVVGTSEATVTKGAKKQIIEVGDQDFTGTLEYVDKDPIPFETEVTIDPSLQPNQIVEDQAGELGEEETKITRTITNGEAGEELRGQTTQTKAPVTRKIRVGAKTDGTHTYTNKKPFEVEVRVNPDLKKGEHKVVQKGVEGEEEYTVTIENSKVTKTSEANVIKTPVKEIIEVGSEDFTGEVKHKETFEIPFEVEVRYNNELPAGKTNEIQKGVNGSYDVEYTQKIKNGSADGKMTNEKSNIVQAKKHIIEVGTKVETPENNYSKDVEVEIEYVYDDTKDKGFVETGELTPGKVETKVVDKYNPETGKVEQTTEQVVTKVKQKVVVGTKDFTGKYEFDKTCPISPKVILRENPDMEAGTSKVVQEGKDGSKTTHVSVDIKNGKVVEGSENETPGETIEAVDHIIEVGTKKAPNTCPVPEEPGEDSHDPENPGHEEPQNPNPEEPGDPHNPNTPEEDPSTPGGGTPEDPNPEEPGTPGEENPSEPGGETPDEPGEENPSEPGTEEPGTLGEENPSDPGTPGTEEPGENIENPEAKTEIDGEDNTGKNTNPNEVNENVSSGVKRLPKTGDGVNVSLYGYLMGVLGSGFLGLGALKKKKDEEDEEN